MEESFLEQAGCAEAGGPTAGEQIKLVVNSGLFLNIHNEHRASPSQQDWAMCTAQHACCSWSVRRAEALSENGKTPSSLSTGETDRPMPGARPMAPEHES